MRWRSKLSPKVVRKLCKQNASSLLQVTRVSGRKCTGQFIVMDERMLAHALPHGFFFGKYRKTRIQCLQLQSDQRLCFYAWGTRLPSNAGMGDGAILRTVTTPEETVG